MYYVSYLLTNTTTNRTYIGITNCLERRLRQHNGDLQGGAKYTRSGRPWHVHAIVYPFPTKSAAMRFEWRWKRTGKGLKRRVAGMGRLLGGRTDLVHAFNDGGHVSPVLGTEYPSGAPRVPSSNA